MENNYKLYDYQQEAVDKTIDYLLNKKGNPVIVAPTGAGKSYIIAGLCQECIKRWGAIEILMLTHRATLVEQDAEKLQNLGFECGIYCAELRKKEIKQITFATIGSVWRKKEEFNKFDLIIIDESHLVNSEQEGMYRKFIASCTNAKVVGLTATPYRLKSGNIYGENRLFSGISYLITWKKLLENGNIVPPVNYNRDKDTDWNKFAIKKGEFDSDQTNSYFTDDARVNKVCADIIEKSKDRNYGIIFCTSIKHAEKVYEYFKNNNVPSCIVHSQMTESREKVLDDFLHKKYKYLINVDVLTTGFDARFIDCVVMLRATMSTALYVQCLGRGCRTYEGKKDFLVLDYGGNINRHGFIDDPDLQTAPIRPKKSGGNTPVKECPECGFCMHPRKTSCPACGYVFPFRHNLNAATGKLLSFDEEDKDMLIANWNVIKKNKNNRWFIELSVSNLIITARKFFFFDDQGWLKKNSILNWIALFGSKAPMNTNEAYIRLNDLNHKYKKVKIRKEKGFYTITKLMEE